MASEEYETEIPYLRTFSADLNPTMLRLVAALNGCSPPPAEDFDYCELGSGNGDTTAALAAAHPEARFVGVDFNPDHIQFANGLASRGGVGNVRFLERDFEHLRQEGLPGFDFITAHGVLSWVSPPKRRALIALALDLLKPGGLLYVSYNALPGWSSIQPLRHLMLDGAGPQGTVIERARRGLALAKLLADSGADYFAHNAAARSTLDTLLKMGLPYVVHEYFQPHWHPLYFEEVAGEMAEHGLHFLGQLPLHLNYRDLCIPATALDLFKGVTDRLVFESLKDYALDESFRRDIYVKGVNTRSENAASDYLARTPFGALAGADRIQREVRLSHYTLKFAGPLFDALIPILAERSATLDELAKLPALTPFGAARIRESILHLLLGGQVVPMTRATPPAATSGGERFTLPLAYNRMILKQRLSSEAPIVLASPLTGTVLPISAFEAVSLRLLVDVAPEKRSEWIRDFVKRQPIKLHVADKPITGAEEQARVLAEELEQFRARRLPKLLDLGIVEPSQG